MASPACGGGTTALTFPVRPLAAAFQKLSLVPWIVVCATGRAMQDLFCYARRSWDTVGGQEIVSKELGPISSSGETMASKSHLPVKIDIALQGGGSHGAFTWGVLDRLLDEEWIEVSGVSGTSAGAMNAVGLVQGLSGAGRNQAKTLLRQYWEAVSEAAKLSPIRRSPVDKLLRRWSLDFSPTYLASDLFGRLFSPYQLNPMNVNTLRDIVARC